MLSASRSLLSKCAKPTIFRAFSSYTPADGKLHDVPFHIGLVDPEWVQERMGKIRILDATLHLDPKREALREFKEVGSVT